MEYERKIFGRMDVCYFTLLKPAPGSQAEIQKLLHRVVNVPTRSSPNPARK